MRRLLALLAGAAALWAFTVWLAGGIDIRAAGRRLTSSDPLRPAAVALASAVLYVATARRRGLRDDAALAMRVATPFRLALILTAASTAVALAFNAQTAGGSDSYGYVTGADLWLSGSLRTPVVPLAATAPWPHAVETFTPFAYHPSPDRRSVVPVISPGLPLMMAAGKLAFGHCAMFPVIPLTGALLIWVTFAAGRRIVSDAVGLGAAWLIATSPTVVSMSKSTMSDVPAAAFWGLSILWVLRPTVGSALGAGLAASMAILIRPNLLPLGLWIGAWLLWREMRRPPRSPRRAIVFAAAAAPGCLAVAAVNHALRGSPLASGYGNASDLFAWQYLSANAWHYLTWTIETQTPVWIAGALALAVPARALWQSEEGRAAAWLLFGTVVAVLLAYLAYVPFEAWWFLRFLLPAWPAIAIGASALLLAAGAAAGAWGRRIAMLAVAALGAFGIAATLRLGVFPPGEGERRYATIAEVVAQHTEPSSVIITLQNSGAVEYYGGRLALRWDELDPQWLDRAIAWLEQQGRTPYVLVEEREIPEFRQRFAGQHFAREMSPALAYKAHRISGWVYLYDPRRPDAPTLSVPPVLNPSRCPLPAVRSRGKG